jgi:hypothetical protein
MEGKHDGQGNETDKEVQQARPTDADRGIVDGVLGNCDSDVLAVKPLQREAEMTEGAGLVDSGFEDSTKKGNTR